LFCSLGFATADPVFDYSRLSKEFWFDPVVPVGVVKLKRAVDGVDMEFLSLDRPSALVIPF
jgi:hypothetical protein